MSQSIVNNLSVIEENSTKISNMIGSIADLAKVTADEVEKEGSAAQTVDLFVSLRPSLDQISEELAKLSKVVGVLKDRVVPAKFEEEGLTTLTTASGYRVSISTRLFASMLDKEEGLKWLKDNGYDAVIQPTVNSSTLSGLAKSLLEEGKELPEDFFKTHFQTSASITQVKNKK